MKSTIRAVSGVVTVQAHPGIVMSNGVVFLPHEAMLLASELERAARKADSLAADAKPELKAA